MTHDPDAFRAASLERWERVAAGWGAQRAVFQYAAQPVSQWLIDAIRPQPGHRVLELAAGPGDTGLLAAELIAPGGTLLSTDGAPAMVELARARAAELGVTNVRFEVMDAEWLDLAAADMDSVICRWGYMLLADPATALRETRRVLKPGGRVALAAWTAPENNPFASVPQREVVRLGAAPASDPDEPNMFAFADPQRIEGLLDEVGFDDIEITQIDIEFRYPDLDAWWDATLEISAGVRAAVAAMTPAQRDELRDAIDARLAAYVAPDGTVALPGRTHVAAASA